MFAPASPPRGPLLALIALHWIVGTALPAAAAPEAAAALGPLRLEIGLGWGELDGFLQIPRGGAEGSTSPRRPSIAELGIDSAPSLAFGAEGWWRAHGIRVEGTLLQPDGSAVLAEPLVNNGTRYEAGARIRSSLRLDTYRFSYRHRFEIDLEEAGRLELLPAVGLGLYDFSLDLSDDAGQRSDRAFLQGFPLVGITIGWRPPVPLRVDATATGLPRVGTNTATLSTGLRVEYVVLGRGRDPRLALHAGVGYGLVDFEDSQPTPNHTRIEHGPVFGLGLSLEL